MDIIKLYEGNNMEGGIDDFLLETEDEIVAENRNVVEDQMLGGDGVVVPKVGMIFSSRRPSTATESLRPQPTIQIDCKARISASSYDHGSWRINVVHLDHNHGTSPSKSRLFRCNREFSAHVKWRLEVNDVAGISLHKSYNFTVVEVGEYENMTCVEKDCRNYIEQMRRLRLGEGDAAAIQAYFSNMQVQCSRFYFSTDLDDESRLRNIFWTDNRCRQAYKEFGDVVTFDTTYLTNKYDMPFAPFVGINHHGQSTLLGCDLLSNEDTNNFVWLFRTWFQCMHGVAPHGIITDKDRAMQNAIQIVFSKYKPYVVFMAHFEEVAREVWFVEEFEEGWITMINKFELHENDWLSGLYENIKHWYVEQYERALRNKVEKEFQADFKSYSQMLSCVSMFEMEKQFQSVYTISKFKEVQEEFVGKMYCDLISTSENSFGTMGIICRHAISVLIRNCITSIPERYILRRWRRDYVSSFAGLADLAADDDGQTRAIMEWIESQRTILTLTRTSTTSNVLAHRTEPLHNVYHSLEKILKFREEFVKDGQSAFLVVNKLSVSENQQDNNTRLSFSLHRNSKVTGTF
ncbi:protein FAR1-RELATED SEQUENCE 5-like [Olea europaea var. sylvestris]|uniref:protein FAR1-RELATED SEQUENCE 5-like n=1 Tax=Olea europaea var. sylvestris TaxID=158386 RepID=UPI000C1CDE76|nr:protein FAR1-RELATED SEQUENCE 5-like [Olea europaea var. sylvestris]